MLMLSDAAAVAAAGGGGGGWWCRVERWRRGVEISYCFLREEHTGLQSCGATLMQSSEREVAFGAPPEQGLRERTSRGTGTQAHTRTYALARCLYTVYLHLLINQL